MNETVLCESGNEYTITKYVSEGGNGFVFECEFECEDKSKKNFIIKVLHTSNDIKIANFKKEIVLSETIDSKYVVKCLDSGEKAFGKQTKKRPFYIMQKFDCSLETLIRNGSITPTKAYEYSLQLCEGLKALHKREEPIIHRDLKPDNILYDAKRDEVLICDLGLAHRGPSRNTTINNSFAGNIDYHAPEQKLRGKQPVGPYTDIYSLGLIINVLFTQEIAQGEGYTKIRHRSPYFSFVDDCVERMIKHDIESREHDIDSIIFELEDRRFEFEFEEAVLLKECEGKGLPKDKVPQLMDLFRMMEFMIKGYENWDGVNLNYLCDFHFSCNKTMIDTLFLADVLSVLKEKFKYEGSVYKDDGIPYAAIDLSEKKNLDLYNSFLSTLNSLEIAKEMESKRNVAKKYFLSLCDYHAKEVLFDLEETRARIEELCIDAPALCIAKCIFDRLPSSFFEEKAITNCVSLLKYEESNVENKNVFKTDINKELKDVGRKLEQTIPGAHFLVKNRKAKVWFDSFHEEELFEKHVKECAESYGPHDVRRQDVLDVISNIEQFSLKKVYVLDNYFARLFSEHLRGL